jgi:hypothetical protein
MIAVPQLGANMQEVFHLGAKLSHCDFSDDQIHCNSFNKFDR